MALPAQTASILQKVALVDVAIGLGMLAWGLSDRRVLPIGVMFLAMGIGMYAWARSQRSRDEDPHAPYR